MQEVEAKLQEYQRLLRERLPISERVVIHEEVARKVDSNPFAALKALQRADRLDDIVMLAERERHPLSTMPPETHVSGTVNTPQACRLEIDDSPEKGVKE
jgi:hypothetical protein